MAFIAKKEEARMELLLQKYEELFTKYLETQQLLEIAEQKNLTHSKLTQRLVEQNSMYRKQFEKAEADKNLVTQLERIVRSDDVVTCQFENGRKISVKYPGDTPFSVEHSVALCLLEEVFGVDRINKLMRDIQASNEQHDKHARRRLQPSFERD